MQAKAKPHVVQTTADNKFRFGILALDTRHHAAAGGFVDDVNQSWISAIQEA